jgi:DNA repair exonuclease SbcCD ATPase subunit
METPAEVQELRNKLRMMNVPQDEIINVVRRQQRALVKQKEANATIRRLVEKHEIEHARVEQLRAEFDADPDLQKLEGTKKQLLNRLSVLQADVSVEEGKCRRIKEEVSRARSKAGGIYTHAEEKESVLARMRRTENRLNMSYTAYNHHLTTMVSLRSEIDELRKQRATFREIMRNTKADREGKDGRIGALISESNDDYAHRDLLKRRLTQVQLAEKQYAEEFQESIGQITERIEMQRVAKNRPPVADPMMTASDSQIGSSSDQIDELMTQTEVMQTAINQALAALHFPTTDALLKDADQLERENFSLYNFVVESAAVNLALQEEIEGLGRRKDELDRLAEMTDEEQSAHLAVLTKQIAATSKNLTETQGLFERESEEFREIHDKIERLFNLVGGSWDDSPDQKSGMSQQNTPFVLSTIEAKLGVLMERVFWQANLQAEATGEEIRVDATDHETGENKARGSFEKDRFPKQIEHSRPLTIEEIQRLL